MGQYQELRLFKEGRIFVQVSAALLSTPHPRSDCSLRRSELGKNVRENVCEFPARKVKHCDILT